jgi:exonuclease III
MRILIWNCQGLGQARTVQELARLVRELKPDLVFLSETRQNKAAVAKVCSRVGFSNCLPISVEGKGGGLALFVSDSVILDLLSYGPHHIDTHVTNHDGNKIRYTFVYGEPRPQDRIEFWKLLKRIKDKSKEP